MSDLNEGRPSQQYVVLDDIGLAVAAVGVGEVSAELDELLEAYDATSGVFVAAHEQLEDELAELGVISLPHIVIDDDHDEAPRAPERGLFAVDLDEGEAVRMASGYHQRAVVVAVRGEPARRVVTGGPVQ